MMINWVDVSFPKNDTLRHLIHVVVILEKKFIFPLQPGNMIGELQTRWAIHGR